MNIDGKLDWNPSHAVGIVVKAAVDLQSPISAQVAFPVC